MIMSACHSFGGVCRIAAGLLALCFSALAAPPPNDLCIGAEVIPGAGPFPFFSSTNDVTEAATLGDPLAPTNCYSGDIARSLWYRFTPAASGTYTVSTKDTATTVVDTLMGVYISPAGCAGPFDLLECNDDVGLGEQVLRSAITMNFDAGTTYYFVIWSTLTNTPAASESAVQLSVSKLAIPANDRCVGAQTIPGAGPFPYLTAVVDAHLATSANDPPNPTCAPAASRSVWYHFNPSLSGAYIFSTCTNATKTRTFDTLVAIYTSSGGCGGTLTPIACNDNFCSFTASVTAPSMIAGTDYYIVVWDLEPDPLSGETDVQLQVVRQGPPIVVTLPVTSLTATGVVLNATANPRGLLTRGYFEYGATTNLGSYTTTNNIGNGTVDLLFSRLVAGLNPGGTYYYRGAASNSLGSRVGDILSFTVPPRNPLITNVVVQAGGLRIAFFGTAGFTHIVQGSDDLKTWSNLGNATPLGGDRFEYVDAGALRPRRFYRIKL